MEFKWSSWSRWLDDMWSCCVWNRMPKHTILRTRWQLAIKHARMLELRIRATRNSLSRHQRQTVRRRIYVARAVQPPLEFKHRK